MTLRLFFGFSFAAVLAVQIVATFLMLLYQPTPTWLLAPVPSTMAYAYVAMSRRPGFTWIVLAGTASGLVLGSMFLGFFLASPLGGANLGWALAELAISGGLTVSCAWLLLKALGKSFRPVGVPWSGSSSSGNPP